jgi:hypothetical protein
MRVVMQFAVEQWRRKDNPMLGIEALKVGGCEWPQTDRCLFGGDGGSKRIRAESAPCPDTAATFC